MEMVSGAISRSTSWRPTIPMRRWRNSVDAPAALQCRCPRRSTGDPYFQDCSNTSSKWHLPTRQRKLRRKMRFEIPTQPGYGRPSVLDATGSEGLFDAMTARAVSIPAVRIGIVTIPSEADKR